MNVRDVVAAGARLYPGRVALAMGDQQITYDELDRLSNRVANVLLRAGLSRKGHVALLMSYRPEWLIAYFGIVKAGARAIVLNAILKEKDYETLLRDSDSTFLLTEHAFVQMLAEVLPRLGRIERVFEWDADAFRSSLSGVPDAMPDISLEDGEDCTIVYTSGVLGRQKGVVHTHASLIEATRLLTPRLEQTGDDVVVGMIPFFYLLGLEVVALISLRLGSRIVLLPRFSTRGALETVARERATMLIGVPAMFNALAQMDREAIAHYDVSSLRTAVTAGAKTSPHLMAQLEAEFGLTLCEAYGTTEAIASTFSGVRDRRLGTIGTPLQQHRIVGPDGRDAAPGEVGELLVRSPTLMTGYYNAPELTAQVFRDGWFHTGDLVSQDSDGYLKYVEKLSFIIVTSAGTKIPPTEVEDVLLTHPDVAEVAFVGVEGPDGNQIPTLFVVPREGAHITRGGLREFCVANLAPTKQPRQIEFIEAIPKTGSGKIDRHAMRKGAGTSLTR